MRLRKLLIGSSVLLALLCVGGFFYLKSLGLFATTAWYGNEHGAIRGYDPVAYFTEGRAVAGDPALSLEWDGATWHFASPEHRTRFEEDPLRYAPAFGGYCAFAVSEGYTANGDPEVWSIVDDRLYLNFDRTVAERWNEERASRIAAGQQNWSALFPDAAPASPAPP